MIRLVTASRIEQTKADARAAYEHARQTSEAANEAFGRHVRELYAVTGRAERAEAATAETERFLAHAVGELAAAQEELLLKDMEIRRLREQLAADPVEGQAITVLLHYGEPHTIYRSREAAHADTSVHGLPADHVWTPLGERSSRACMWSCEPFIYRAASQGFRRAYMPAAEPMGGAA
ncbi:hypothetical protein [Streptomyces longispororuber]|uniref:hypothetical protein n=1 Tax=Streptomyces longispororuber TaxID=68230 RepID=UPI00210B4F63|nr:hypothetical protein [Streptomyces longispororuber]MCQ4212380.1 hypothetical protein [Streptomyces longispororuber]